MQTFKIFIFIVSTVLLSNYTYAQDFSYRDGKVFYEFIDTIQGTKNENFDKVKIWIAKYFTDTKATINLEDKELGKIIGKSILDIEEFSGILQGKHPSYFTFDLTIKDNKIRLQIFDILYDLKYDIEIVKNNRIKDKKDYAEFIKVIKQVNGQINYLHKSMVTSINTNETF